MAEIWKADEYVYDMMRECVANWHPHLASIDHEIAIVFKPKASKSGGVVTMGVTSKAAPILAELSDTEYKFILTIGDDIWSDLNNLDRKRLLDSLLCACQVEEDDNGALKCSLRKPDVIGYQEEFERHGIWRVSGEVVPRDLIAEMFSPKAEGTSESDE